MGFWDSLATMFKTYITVLIFLTPLETIISYPYYKLGLIENPLGNVSLQIKSFNNTTLEEICLYYNNIQVTNDEVKSFLESTCSSAQIAIEASTKSSFLGLFWGILNLLVNIGTNLIANLVAFPFIVYSKIEPFTRYNELLHYGAVTITSALVVLHYVGFVALILQRIRGR